MSYMSDGLTFHVLQEVNRRRQEEKFSFCAKWRLTDWMLAILGEAGEAANLVKKRENRSESVPVEDIANELADVVIYCDLMASEMGVDLSEAIVRKFNEVSLRIGSSYRIREDGTDWCIAKDGE